MASSSEETLIISIPHCVHRECAEHEGCREDSSDRHETTPESPRHLFRVVDGLSQTDSGRKKSKGIAEQTPYCSAEEDDVDVIRLELGIMKCHLHSNEDSTDDHHSDDQLDDPFEETRRLRCAAQEEEAVCSLRFPSLHLLQKNREDRYSTHR